MAGRRGLWLLAGFSSVLALGLGAVGPASAKRAAGDGVLGLFQTSDRCMACHNSLTTPEGEDVSIGSSWRASMMANSARDPYWHAAVRREVLERPAAREAIEDKCSTCHMPMARYAAHVEGASGGVFAHLPVTGAVTALDRQAADGVSCTVCHQITPDKLGEEESFTGGFVIDTERPWGERTIYGPFEVDTGRRTIMSSASAFLPAEATHIRSSELCATCHTLYTHALGRDGEVVGELPEQVPYLEWLHSDYRAEQSCQSCHMPVVEEDTPVTSVLGEPRSGFSRHVFRGGNFFMMRVLGRYGEELGVAASPDELETAARRTVDHLETSAAELEIVRADTFADRLEAEVTVANLAGHKLPTAYPSRRAWIHLTVRDADGEVIFESGALAADGRIEGNDNDDDAGRYEPHHRAISSPDQVQVYEAIMVGPEDRVTTVLLTGVRYAKDNRLLPRGFGKADAPEDVAVRGEALEDADFIGGGDRVRYSIALAAPYEGPLRIEAELLYQPIAYRWARNLGEQDAPEIDRFLGYYEAMADATAAVLARSSRTVD